MLSENVCVQIDKELLKYPEDRKCSAVMAALRFVQEEHRFLSSSDIKDIAAYLQMPVISVWEVATFYNMYDTSPVGVHKLCICTNLPCALQGSLKSANYLKKRLGIEFGETTKDGLVTLVEGECFGACVEAPVMLHNNHKMLCRMTEEQIEDFLSEIKK